ncbi:MAG: hypothetical protein IKR97_07410, partial [Eubacterium sp.]|nr:hypothetical protein [Eubacterium sp.]
EQNEMSLEITRLEETGSLTLSFNVVDDYGREYSVVRDVLIVEKIIPVTDLALTVDGAEVQANTTYTVSCGGNFSNFPGLTVGCIALPSNANDLASVSYKTSSSSSPIKINASTGEVTFSGLFLFSSSYSTDITCTITNNDGSTVAKKFTLKVNKK